MNGDAERYPSTGLEDRILSLEKHSFALRVIYDHGLDVVGACDQGGLAKVTGQGFGAASGVLGLRPPTGLPLGEGQRPESRGRNKSVQASAAGHHALHRWGSSKEAKTYSPSSAKSLLNSSIRGGGTPQGRKCLAARTGAGTIALALPGRTLRLGAVGTGTTAA